MGSPCSCWVAPSSPELVGRQVCCSPQHTHPWSGGFASLPAYMAVSSPYNSLEMSFNRRSVNIVSLVSALVCSGL